MSENKNYIYQAMLLLDNQEIRSQGFNAVRDWVKNALEKQGITVKVLRLWGERKLAYPIGQRRRATYLLGWLEADGEAVNAAKREFYLVGPVFRTLFLREDEIPEEELAFGIEEVKDEDVQIPDDEPDVVEEEPYVEESRAEEGDDAKKKEGEGESKDAKDEPKGEAKDESKGSEEQPQPVASAKEDA